MIDKPRLRKGEGKVQYYACREQVARLLEAGYSIRAIYDRLVSDGIVSSSYRGFYQNVMYDKASAGKEVKINPARTTNQAAPAGERPAPIGRAWSLDQKVASLNFEAQHSGKKRANSELSEFDESEVL